MLDFDNNHAWGPELAAALGELVPDTVVAKLVANSPQYMEDARDLLLSCVDKTHIIDVTLSWIKSNSIAAYHGCRLDQFELEAVRTLGLLPPRRPSAPASLAKSSLRPSAMGLGLAPTR